MSGEERQARLRLLAAGAAVLAVLVVTGLLLGVVARGRSDHGTHPTSTSTSTTPGARGTASRGDDTSRRSDAGPDLEAAYRMPATDDPIEFGQAYIRALLTYDTTQQSYSDRRTALLGWTPKDGWFDDAEPMLDDFLGGSDTWAAATRVHQSQTVVINKAWVPESVTTRMKDDPDAFEQTHWPYIVTATVVRQLRGDVGVNSDLPFTISVLVSCPPDGTCVALAPGRSVVED